MKSIINNNINHPIIPEIKNTSFIQTINHPFNQLGSNPSIIYQKKPIFYFYIQKCKEIQQTTINITKNVFFFKKLKKETFIQNLATSNFKNKNKNLHINNLSNDKKKLAHFSIHKYF